VGTLWVACRTCQKVVEMPGGFSYQYALAIILLGAASAARLVQCGLRIGVAAEGEGSEQSRKTGVNDERSNLAVLGGLFRIDFRQHCPRVGGRSIQELCLYGQGGPGKYIDLTAEFVREFKGRKQQRQEGRAGANTD
jgi:hypothetical protein